MTDHTVRITTVLDPDPVTVESGDTIVWQNDSSLPQSMTSDDGGKTFTTGPVQVGSRSLPIVFRLPSPGTAYTATSGIKGTVVVTVAKSDGVSFAATIKPYFTELDRTSMMDPNHTFGIINFDLWARADCEANWDDIFDSIKGGRMPPPGGNSDGPWPQAKIDQFVVDFTGWKAGGFVP